MERVKKLFSQKYKLKELYTTELPESQIQAGEHKVTIIDCKVIDYYGEYEGSKKVTLKFELKEGVVIEKNFFVNSGNSNELASLVGEVLTEYEGEEIDLRDLIGKLINGIVTYYFDNNGNVVYNISNYKEADKS